ncbi:LPXTG cell wall anchor domain-containing protein [Radiobacillus sp. PE A8.2]
MVDGDVLPNTAANQYKLLLAGAQVGLIGFMALLVRRRKSVN